MLEIMKIIDERKTQKQTKTKTEKNKGDKNYSERVRAKWFRCAFKLGFLQLMCKASLIFKSNLELTLPIILKKKNYASQRMLLWSVDIKKYETYYPFFDMFLSRSFKMVTSFANIVRTTASTSKLIY